MPRRATIVGCAVVLLAVPLLLHVVHLGSESRESRRSGDVRKPAIAVDATRVELGTWFQGQEVHHAGTIFNRGDADLIVRRIRVNCSCVVTRLGTSEGRDEDVIVPPGGSTPFEVALRFSRIGESRNAADVEQPIRVISNDPDAPDVGVMLRGRVVSPLADPPRSIELGEVWQGREARRSTTISVGNSCPVVVTGVTARSPFVTCEWTELAEGSRTYRIDVGLSSRAPIGKLKSAVVVSFAGGGVPDFEVPVVASVRPRARCVAEGRTVRSVDFGVVRPVQGVVGEITVVCDEPALGYVPVRATASMAAAGEAAECGIVEVERGAQYRIQVRVPPDAGGAGFFRGTLKVSSDAPEVQDLEIAFCGWRSG